MRRSPPDDTFSVWPRALLTVPFSRRTYLNLGLGPLLRGSEDVGDLELGSELRSVGGVHVGLTDVFGLTAEADRDHAVRRLLRVAQDADRGHGRSSLRERFLGCRRGRGRRPQQRVRLARLQGARGRSRSRPSPWSPRPRRMQKLPIDTDHDGIADARDQLRDGARGLRPLPGRRRLPRPRQRSRPARRRQATSAPTKPRTSTDSRTKTAAPTSTTTRTSSPTSRGQVPRPARGLRQLPGRRRVSRRRQRSGRARRRAGPMPERGRDEERRRGR